MLSNFLTGAAVKLGANLLNNWFANMADREKAIHMQNEAVIKAHAELQKQHNDVVSKVVRGIIFLTFTGSFCFVGVWGMMNPQESIDVLVPVQDGFFNFFRKAEFKPVELKGGTLLFQWWQGMEMILGAYVVPSRRR